jgi:hypothetical protein
LSFLDSVKQDIQHFFATRRKLTVHRTGKFTDLIEPRALGLFFCIETVDELNQIRALVGQVNKQYKSVTALVFSQGYESLDLVTDKSIVLFDYNDFDLFGKKKESLLLEFEMREFELLISFLVKEDLFCLKLLSEIKADFKIGPYMEGWDAMYDMTMLYRPDLFGIAGFYQSVRHYLEVLNISMYGKSG